MSKDTIYRQDAIDAVVSLCDDCDSDNCGSCRVNFSGVKDARKVLKALPSARTDIKQAAKLLSDFIESCPGGDSYLITPDGEELRTDWGYATEGIRLIHDWAERIMRNDKAYKTME